MFSAALTKSSAKPFLRYFLDIAKLLMIGPENDESYPSIFFILLTVCRKSQYQIIERAQTCKHIRIALQLKLETSRDTRCVSRHKYVMIRVHKTASACCIRPFLTFYTSASNNLIFSIHTQNQLRIRINRSSGIIPRKSPTLLRNLSPIPLAKLRHLLTL